MNYAHITKRLRRLLQAEVDRAEELPEAQWRQEERRQWERAHGCLRKRRYDTMAEATTVAKQASKAAEERIEAYPCRFCGGFHVGHKKKKHLGEGRDASD